MAFTNSVKGSVGPAGVDGGYTALTAAARHRTKVLPLPEPDAGGTICEEPTS